MYYLAPSVRACVDQDVVIFIDLKRDGYFSIDTAVAPPIEGITSGGSGRADAALIARGLIQSTPGAAGEISQAPASLTDELSEQAFRHASANGVHWAAMLTSCLQAEATIRSRRLDVAFEEFGRRKTGGPDHRETLAAEVARFELMRPWYPRSRVCLFDSLALMNFLLVRGSAPKLVLGVRARPFSAHCWLESGAVCLNDAAEACGAYTPIAWV